MFKKLKLWVVEHNMIPLVVVIIAIVIGSIISFLLYFKSPISLDSKKDYDDIITLIKSYHGDSIIVSDLSLKTIVFRGELSDSVKKISSYKLKSEDDIAWYTRVIEYDIICNRDTARYITIFEISENFLKERVGKGLITFKKE